MKGWVSDKTNIALKTHFSVNSNLFINKNSVFVKSKAKQKAKPDEKNLNAKELKLLRKKWKHLQNSSITMTTLPRATLGFFGTVFWESLV